MSLETAEQPKEKVKSMFGKVDKKHLFDRETDEYKGEHIGSSYPAYMHKSAVDSLDQSVEETQEQLDSGRVASSALEYTKRQLKKEKQRASDIQEQIPDYTPAELKHISESRKDLDKEISSALFSEYDMEKTTNLAAKEATRMTEPCIKVDKKLAAMCNVELDRKGMCSRSNAEKIRKMALWHETGGESMGFTDELRQRTGSYATKSQVGVDIDIKGLERKRLEEEADLREKQINNRIDEIQEELKEEKVNDEMLDAMNNPSPESVVNPMWTCPDCNKEMKGSAKGVHKSRWCPALKKE